MTPGNLLVRPRPAPSPSPGGRGEPSRCQIALSRACGSQFGSEIGNLLRRRLALVALIALLPTAVFLGRNLLETHHRVALGAMGLVLHAGVTIIQASLAGLLLSRACLSLRSLRRIELVLFGSLAAFFCWLQFTALGNERLFGRVNPD